MSCTLTSGYTLDCKDSVGGLKEMYFIEFANVSSYTLTGNVITAITKASGKVFRKYELVRETAYLTQTYNDNIQNGTSYVTQEIELFIAKLSTTMRDEIQLLGQNRLIAVVVDNNGKAWLLGKTNGVERNGGSASTGTAFGDRNGYVLKFVGMEPFHAYEFTGSLSGLTA